MTMTVVVTSGRVVVGPHNPWFYPHASSHVWILENGDEDNNIERHRRSKFDQQSSYELFAAAHPRFLSHRTLPVTLSTLWDFKSRGKGTQWSGIKLASFIFNQLLGRRNLLKSDVIQWLPEVQSLETSSTEKASAAIVANLRRLGEIIGEQETGPVSVKISHELRQLAEKLQSEISKINNDIISEEVKLLIENIIHGKQEK